MEKTHCEKNRGRRKGGEKGVNQRYNYLHSSIDCLRNNLRIGRWALFQLFPVLVKRRRSQRPGSPQRNSGRILVPPLGELGVRVLCKRIDAVQAKHDVSLGVGVEVVHTDGELVGEAAFAILGEDDLEAAVTDLQRGFTSEGVDAWEEGKGDDKGSN